MGETFKEQLVKRKKRFNDTLWRLSAVFFVITLVLLSPSFGMFANLVLLAAIGCAFLFYYLLSYLKVEYEYILTNDILDIDIIYNKARRKSLFSGSVKEIDIMARAGDNTHKSEFAQINETKDYSSGNINDGRFIFKAYYKGKNQKIVFEPNENMLKAISAYMSPRKLYR